MTHATAKLGPRRICPICHEAFRRERGVIPPRRDRRLPYSQVCAECLVRIAREPAWQATHLIRRLATAGQTPDAPCR